MAPSFREVLNDIGLIIPALYEMIEQAHEKSVLLIEAESFNPDPWFFSHCMRKYIEKTYTDSTTSQDGLVFPSATILPLTGISLHHNQYHIKIKKSKAILNEDDSIVPSPATMRQTRFYNQDDIRCVESGVQLRFEDYDPNIQTIEEKKEKEENNQSLKANLILLYDLDNNYLLNGDLKLALPVDAACNSQTVTCHWIQDLPRYVPIEMVADEVDDIDIPFNEKTKESLN